MAKILVIDDEGSILQALGILLRSEGHDVELINDSGAAVDLIRNNDYDLMLTDIRMTPVDGMQLLALAHKSKPNMPVIIVSAYGAENTEKEGFGHGCVAYIKKPFKIEEIVNAVRKALSAE